MLPVTTLAVSLIGGGLSRADLFLLVGDLRALFIRIGARVSISWGWLLPIALLLSVGPVVANVVAVPHPDFGTGSFGKRRRDLFAGRPDDGSLGLATE